MKTYHVKVDFGDDGWLVAQASEEPAAITQGRTLLEINVMIRDSIRGVTQQDRFAVTLEYPLSLSGITGTTEPWTQSTVIKQIERAFRTVRLEDGTSLSQAAAIDAYQDERAARKRDGERRWEEVSDDKLIKLGSSIGFLDTKGFHFYIPAFMRWNCRNPQVHSAVVDAIGWALNPIKLRNRSIDTDLRFAERLGALTSEQCAAVRAFLEFMGVANAPVWLDDALGGLKYWKKRD